MKAGIILESGCFLTVKKCGGTILLTGKVCFSKGDKVYDEKIYKKTFLFLCTDTSYNSDFTIAGYQGQ